MSYRLPEYSIVLESTPSNVCRAVIGHLLAARISFNGPMMDDMRSYVLDPDVTLLEKYHLYSWLFPKEEYSVSPECCIVNTPPQFSAYDCYKVFPLGFLFTDVDWTMPGTLDLLSYPNGKIVSLKLDCLNHPHPDWPESGLNLPASMSRIFGANMNNSLKYIKSP